MTRKVQNTALDLSAELSANYNKTSHLSKGKGFEQLNRNYLLYHLPELITSCPQAAALFFKLAAKCTQNNVFHVKHERRMLAIFGMQRRTYYQALKDLEDRLWIKRDKADKDIHLNALIVWHGRQPATQWNCELLCEPKMPPRDEKWLKAINSLGVK